MGCRTGEGSVPESTKRGRTSNVKGGPRVVGTIGHLLFQMWHPEGRGAPPRGFSPGVWGGGGGGGGEMSYRLFGAGAELGGGVQSQEVMGLGLRGRRDEWVLIEPHAAHGE